jgi:hypothetical protein
MSRIAAKKLALACCLLSAPGVTGCTPFNLRGNGYGDYTSNWGENLRKPTAAGESVGLDKRAQEIERNLGVR